jgi:hypothetical protein
MLSDDDGSGRNRLYDVAVSLMEDLIIWIGAMVVIVGFYATPLFPIWLMVYAARRSWR